MKWKIGNVKIDNQTVLAPMSGICDNAFRTIIKSMGCGLIETEMVSNNAIVYSNRKTIEMLYMTEYERPLSQQIFGSTVESFKTASQYVSEKMNPDIIDINMGCPVNKVAVLGKAGSALLKNPSKVYDIVKTVVETVDIPVTVKIRSGWDKKHVNALEISKIIEDAGASAITVHPRTRTQGYEGEADWSLIKEIKEELSIPVIGNGDVRSCYDAKRMIDTTGCDAVMMGRAVLGNPWLIRECIDYLDKNAEPETVTLEEKIEMFKKHAELLIKNRGEKMAILKLRTHASYYVKGLQNNALIKDRIFQTKTREELFSVLDNLLTE